MNILYSMKKWGEYKCKIKQRYIYEPYEKKECEYYKKSTKKDDEK